MLNLLSARKLKSRHSLNSTEYQYSLQTSQHGSQQVMLSNVSMYFNDYLHKVKSSIAGLQHFNDYLPGSYYYYYHRET